MKECNDRYLMQRRYGRFFANGNMRDVVAVITCARGLSWPSPSRLQPPMLESDHDTQKQISLLGCSSRPLNPYTKVSHKKSTPTQL